MYEAFETAKQIYRAAGNEDACKMVIGEGDHRFYPDVAWPIFETMI